jgi:hypothetical protein
MKRFGNDRENKDSRLPERLRNLSITTIDDELTGNRTTRERHDDDHKMT